MNEWHSAGVCQNNSKGKLQAISHSDGKEYIIMRDARRCSRTSILLLSQLLPSAEVIRC